MITWKFKDLPATFITADVDASVNKMRKLNNISPDHKIEILNDDTIMDDCNCGSNSNIEQLGTISNDIEAPAPKKKATKLHDLPFNLDNLDN
jgi:hypothetical protein